MSVTATGQAGDQPERWLDERCRLDLIGPRSRRPGDPWGMLAIGALCRSVWNMGTGNWGGSVINLTDGTMHQAEAAVPPNYMISPRL